MSDMKCDRILAVLSTIILFSGCGVESAKVIRSRQDNTLHTAWRTDATTLDPAIADDWFTQTLLWALYDGLFDYDDSGTVLPNLAAALPEVINAGRARGMRRPIASRC